MIKVRGAQPMAQRRVPEAQAAARGVPGACPPPGKFFEVTVVKLTYQLQLLYLPRFGIELGQRKIQSSSASYICIKQKFWIADCTDSRKT